MVSPLFHQFKVPILAIPHTQDEKGYSNTNKFVNWIAPPLPLEVHRLFSQVDAGEKVLEK